jgi:hypothetical protein
LTCSLSLDGTLNARGQDIIAPSITIGSANEPIGWASVQNDGLVVATTWTEVNGSNIRLNHPGYAIGSLFISGNSTLTYGYAAGQAAGLTISDPALADISIIPFSQLILEVDDQASGWVFRWANPTIGDHIVDLQTLINGGEIAFVSLNGDGYFLSADSQYTYINVVPEPGSLALLGAVAVAAAARIRRWWA